MAAIAKAIQTLRLDSAKTEMDLERNLDETDPPGKTQRLFHLPSMIAWEEREQKGGANRKAQQSERQPRDHENWTTEVDIGRAVCPHLLSLQISVSQSAHAMVSRTGCESVMLCSCTQTHSRSTTTTK